MTVRRGLAGLAAALVAAGCARAPREAPGRTLRVLSRGDFTSLDPHASFDDTSAFVLCNLFEGLVRFDDQLRLRPALLSFNLRERLRGRPGANPPGALAAGDFEATVEGYGCTSGDPSELLTYMLHTRDDAAGLGPGNTAAYSTPEVDRLADANLRILQSRERLPMLRRALRLAEADLAYLPLVAAQDVYLVSRRLRFSPPVHAEVRLDEVAWAGRP